MWTDVYIKFRYPDLDPQSAYSLFSQGDIDMYNDCFPLRTVKSGYKTRKPWLSEGLKSQSREKISYTIVKKRPKTQSMKLFIKSNVINWINLCRLLNENIMSIACRKISKIWRLPGVSWRKYLIKIRIICHVCGSISITRYVMIKNALQKASIHFYPSALRAGGVLSSRSGRADWRAGGWAGGCQTCGTHISVTAWWIFSVRSSMELSRPVVVHCHAHLPICPIWACPWAENMSNLPQIGSRLCGSHISETAGWIYPI